MKKCLLPPSSTLSEIEEMKELRLHLSDSPEATDLGSPPGGRRILRLSRPIRPSDYPRSPSRLSSSSSSSIPFSWEQRPGIPKTAGTPKSHPSDPLLPLPPRLRSSSFDSFLKKRSDASASDPFAVALAECSKESCPADEAEFSRRKEKATVRQQKPAVWSISDRFGIFGLVGSCKGGRGRCSVADSTVYVPRSSLRTGGAYRLLNHRAA